MARALNVKRVVRTTIMSSGSVPDLTPESDIKAQICNSAIKIIDALSNDKHTTEFDCSMLKAELVNMSRNLGMLVILSNRVKSIPQKASGL